MTRVERPSPTARHPLAGLWRSTGMLHTSIMSVRYDFTGAAARIVANEVGYYTSLTYYAACTVFPDCFNTCGCLHKQCTGRVALEVQTLEGNACTRFAAIAVTLHNY